MSKFSIIFLYVFSLCEIVPQSCSQKDSQNSIVCDTLHVINGRETGKEIGDTLVSHGITYVTLNCDGGIKALDYYPSGELLSISYYKGEIFSMEIDVYDPKSGESRLKSYEYYKRIPDGKWVYYKKDGSLWKKIDFSIED